MRIFISIMSRYLCGSCQFNQWVHWIVTSFFFLSNYKLFKFISEKMAFYSYVWAVAVSVIELMELNIDNWIIFRTKHFQRNKTQLRDCWFLCFAINKIYRFALIIICRNLKKNCDNIQNMLTIFVHFFFISVVWVTWLPQN